MIPTPVLIVVRLFSAFPYTRKPFGVEGSGLLMRAFDLMGGMVRPLLGSKWLPLL